MGYGMGKLQIIEHDGQGGLRFEERPFVVMDDGAYVDLGTRGHAEVGRGLVRRRSGHGAGAAAALVTDGSRTGSPAGPRTGRSRSGRATPTQDSRSTGPRVHTASIAMRASWMGPVSASMVRTRQSASSRH